MSHTTTLYDKDGQEIGVLLHNGDWSGQCEIRMNDRWPVQYEHFVLPGEIIQAIRRGAILEAQEESLERSCLAATFEIEG